MSGAGDKQEIRQRIGSGFAREVQRVPIAAAQKILDSPSPVVGITRARCYLPGEGGNAHQAPAEAVSIPRESWADTRRLPSAVALRRVWGAAKALRNAPAHNCETD